MLKTKEYLSDLAQKCITKSRLLGATDVEISIGNSISDTLNFRNRKVEHSDRSEVLSLGLTTYIGKKKSNVSTSNIKNDNLDNLIERCIQCTKVSPEDNFICLPEKKDLEKNPIDLKLYDETKVSHSFKKEFLKEMEEEVFKNPNIKNSNGSSFSENK